MTFKEYARADVPGTFFNVNEFSDTHTIKYGQWVREMLIQLDDHELTEREKRMKNVKDATAKKQTLIYVQSKEFGPLPTPGKILGIDGKEFVIVEAENEYGVYSIQLEAVKS